MNEKEKKVHILGYDVQETDLRSSLRDILEKRGLTAQLIIEDEPALKRRLAEREPPPYYNIYKYAFF